MDFSHSGYREKTDELTGSTSQAKRSKQSYNNIDIDKVCKKKRKKAR